MAARIARLGMKERRGKDGEEWKERTARKGQRGKERLPYKELG